MSLLHEDPFSSPTGDGNPYAAPQTRLPPPDMPGKRPDVPIRRDLRIFAIQAIILIVLAALMLDGGRFLRIASLAVVAHLLAILVILLRRGENWRRSDKLIVRWGLFATLVMTSIVAAILGRS